MQGREWLWISFAILVIIVQRIRSKQQNPTYNSKSINERIGAPNLSEIPANCPHCKNPNTKLIPICEWCGNKII